MAYSWKILRGAVEQEILFPSEKTYEAYLEQLIRKEEPFEIVDEQENEDGTMTVIMRKRYNNNEFLRREPELPETVTLATAQAFEDLAYEMEKECGNWQELPDTEMTVKLRERIIEEVERFKN